MISLDQYKAMVGPQLRGMTEEEIHRHFVFDSLLAAYLLKKWLRGRGMEPGGHGKLAPS